MKRTILAAALVVFAGQEQALSCAVPALEDIFAHLQQASPDRAIVLGVLHLNDAQLDHVNEPTAGFPAVM